MDMRTEKNIRYPERFYSSSAFHTVGESEGSGSSGRIDPEIAASEVSSTPMRKCINLNSESQEAWGVPTHVLPLTNLPQSERKDLVRRLRKELELIQTIQKKVELFRTNSFSVSSSSDILSCSNIRNGPVENVKNTSNLTPGQGEKSKVPCPRKGQGCNRGVSDRFELTMQASVPNIKKASSAVLMKQCEALLKRVMLHKHAWIFNEPVDVVKLNIPDYFTIIKHPMDLGTVKTKLSSGAYTSPMDFLADVRLTFNNALTYNPAGTDAHFMANVVSTFFETRWKAIQKKLPKTDCLILPAKCRPHDFETIKSMPPSKKTKVASLSQEVIPMPTKRAMTDEEKLNLGRLLESLIGEMPLHIIDFLREQSYGGKEGGEDEIEIDIDELSDDALFKLRKLLDDHLQEKQRNNVITEPCVIEMLNDSGVSNSSVQPSKGSGGIDEGANIGGRQAPVSTCAPVEIDMDDVHRKNKCRRPDNSKDSDSSTSESDSEYDKAPNPVHVQVPETLGSEGPLTDSTTLDDPFERNQSGGGYDQIEQTSGKPSSVASDSNQDGDCTASEKPVSPDRLYRAAILKERFADTILRAREKTMGQGDKGDPEKLRREREELELEQRKEKARLQAEAKAAQDAQRRAEEEAAAEARRKRELEREAARQALLQMEKSVIIDENSQFLEDLEMLRAAPSEQLPSSVDETSPDHHSQDGLGGGFKLVGSNPLEQLGLFMKQDEEDEENEPNIVSNSVKEVEENELNIISNSVKDVEEGEVD